MGSENDIKFMDVSKKVEELVERGNITDAEKIIKPAIAYVESIQNNGEKFENYTFDSAIEFIAYNIFFNDSKKDIKWIKQIYSRLYTQYGYILFEEKELDLAYQMQLNTIKWNPMSISAYYEMAAISLQKEDLEKFLEYTIKAGKRCLTFRGMAKYFRNLGYYYIEKNEFKLALCLYTISLIYDKNNNAYGELDYIKQVMKDDFSVPDYKECFDYAKEKEIDILPNIKVLSRLYSFADGQKITDKTNLQLIKQIYQLVYDFVLDEEIKPKIKNIDELIAKKNNGDNISKIKIDDNKKDIEEIKSSNDEKNNNDIEIVFDENISDNPNGANIKEEIKVNKTVDEAAKEILNKLNINNNLIVSTALEIIKLVINILLSRNKKENIKIIDFSKTLNVLMMNTYKSFTLTYNDMDNDILVALEKYYNMDENVQTEVIGSILFGLRKVRDEENIF